MSRQVQLRKIVGKLIAKKRKEAELTQVQVAELVNLSTEGYARYERGDSSPDIELLGKLATIFNCAIDELVVEVSNGMTAQAQQLANLLDAVPASDRAEIIKIVESCVAIARKKPKNGLKPQ